MKNEEIKMIENLRVNKNVYTIRWQLTFLCNYYCDFCIQGNRDKHVENSKGESAEVRRQICDKIISFIENELNGKYKRLRIFLIGGEVTVLKDFPAILQKLAHIKFDGDIEYFITTNLSMSTKKLLEITNIFKANKHKKYERMLRIGADFYKEFTTEKEFIQKIKLIHNSHKIRNYLVMKQARFREGNIFKKSMFKIIKHMEKKNCNVILSIGYPLMNDKDYEEYKKFKSRNRRYTDTMNYIVIRNYREGIPASLKENLKRENKKKVRVTMLDNSTKYFYRTDDISLEVIGGFNPKGMLCDSGVNCISINNLGLVSRCSYVSKENFITNLLKEDLKQFTETIVCPNTHCYCEMYNIIKRQE